MESDDQVGHIMVNGALQAATVPSLNVNNRSFLYGDGLFETIRVVQGRALFLGAHVERLTAGGQALGLEMPEELLSEGALGEKLAALLEQNEIAGSARIRLTLFREAGGTYKPDGNRGKWVAEVKPMNAEGYVLNETGLVVDTYPHMWVQKGPLSPYKTTSALISVMGGMYAEEMGWDDCLLVDRHMKIPEATSSNLFIVQDGVLYTPPVEDGCVRGVMRKEIMSVAGEQNIEVLECSLKAEQLLRAEECFLTNSVAGVRWIGRFRTKTYNNRIARSLLEKLNQRIRNASGG